MLASGLPRLVTSSMMVVRMLVRMDVLYPVVTMPVDMDQIIRLQKRQVL
jgi:hypothetical protein